MVTKRKKRKKKQAGGKEKHLVRPYIQVEQKPLTVNEASDYLRISSKTLTGLLMRGEIPARRIGRQWRIFKPALDRWLAGGTSKGT